MTILNQFYLGLNNRVRPSGLSTQAAPRFTNIDNSSGSIVATKKDIDTMQNADGTIIFRRQNRFNATDWFATTDRSAIVSQYGIDFFACYSSKRPEYSQMVNKLVPGSNTVARASGTIIPLGLDRPTQKPSSVQNTTVQYTYPTAEQIIVRSVYASRSLDSRPTNGTVYDQVPIHLRMVIMSEPDTDNNNAVYALNTKDISLNVGAASGPRVFGEPSDVNQDYAFSGQFYHDSSSFQYRRVGFTVRTSDDYTAHNIKFYVRAGEGTTSNGVTTYTDADYYEIPDDRNSQFDDTDTAIQTTSQNILNDRTEARDNISTLNLVQLRKGNAFTGTSTLPGRIGRCTATYRYTYGDSISGTESVSSPSSDGLNVSTSGVAVTISNISVPTQTNIDTVNIYRSCPESGEEQFVKLATITKSGNTWVDSENNRVDIGGSISFIDELGDIANRVDLINDTNDNLPPVFGTASNPEYPSQIISSYGSYFAVVGSRLYYTKPGEPHYWNPLASLAFPDDITGILQSTNGLLVFTRNSTHLLTGTTAATFTQSIVTNQQGCIHPRTCQYIDNQPLWMSNDGLCTFNGRVTVLTRDYLTKDTFDQIIEQADQPAGNIFSAVHDNVYYILGGTDFYSFDFRHGQTLAVVKHEKESTESNLVFIGAFFDDKLYGIRDSNPTVSGSRDILELFGDDTRYNKIGYTSPIITLNRFADLKRFKEISFRYEGKLRVGTVAYVNTNGTEPNRVNLDPINFTNEKSNVVQRIPQNYKAAYAVQFVVDGVDNNFHVLDEISFFYDLNEFPEPRNG